METTGFQLSPEHFMDLLLQHKYLDAVRRVARGVAHGYNNIFTGLGGQITLLQQEAAALQDQAFKRNGLIGDLLQRGVEQTAILSGLTQGANLNSHSQLPLVLAIRAAELLNCISRVHRIELASKVQMEKVVCNAQDIMLMLFYLGENCVDATPEGGTVFLEVCCDEPENGNNPPKLVFRFRDHGPGFPDGILDLVGDPFMTNRYGSPNRGLGIHVAQILASRNNGRLSYSRSSENETLTSIVFPLAVEEPRVRVSEIDTARKKGAAGINLSRQCFLVVEDDEAMRILLLNRLQRRGHMVFCVRSCVEALDEYALLFDMITTVLMDVGLRDASGYDCYQKMLGINPKVRIIFMSGQDAMIPKEIERDTVFLQKPFTLDQLEKAVCDVHI